MFSLLAARDTTTRYEIPSAAVSRSSLRIRFDNLTSIPSGRPPLYHRPEFRTIPWRVEVCPLARAHFELAYDLFVHSDEAEGVRLRMGRRDFFGEGFQGSLTLLRPHGLFEFGLPNGFDFYPRSLCLSCVRWTEDFRLDHLCLLPLPVSNCLRTSAGHLSSKPMF